MTRFLILGGAGAVGREMARLLAADPGNEIVVAGRNRVLLEELSDRLGCDWIRLDLAGEVPAPRALPEVDVVVDLTYGPVAHPRIVLRQAEATATFLSGYLDHFGGARAVHASSWVVAATQPAPQELSTRLAWEDGYGFAKTAIERALSRDWRDGRMKVVRLANVVTGETGWGSILLRALRAGAVLNPEALRAPAALCTVGQIIDHIDVVGGARVETVTAAAAWSWGQVLDAAARAADLPDNVRFDAPAGPVPAAPAPSKAKELAGTVTRRALWGAPLAIAKGPADTLPIPPVVLSAARRLLQPSRPTGVQLPPPLPVFPPMEGAQRDPDALDQMSAVLRELFYERGYAAAYSMAR